MSNIDMYPGGENDSMLSAAQEEGGIITRYENVTIVDEDTGDYISTFELLQGADDDPKFTEEIED